MELGDTSGYGEYISGGLITQKKKPITKEHKSFEVASQNPELPFTDGMKFDQNIKMHALFMVHYY